MPHNKMIKGSPMAQRLYIKWILDAIAKNPHLSQSGLARALGRDRSAISLMMHGKRRIQVDELPAIASYLGVPPPDGSITTNLITVMIVGRVSKSDWTADFAPLGETTAFAFPHPRFPPGAQVAFEIAPQIQQIVPRLGDIAIAVKAKDYRTALQPDDLIVYEKEMQGLTHWGLARVILRSHTVTLISVVDQTPVRVDDEKTWLVIGSITRFA